MSNFDAIRALRDWDDDDAKRELVGFLESSDHGVALEAARALEEGHIPEDVRERVAAALLAGDEDRSFAYRVGARALVGHPRAFELLEPLLRVDVLSSQADRERAGVVLWQLENQLARCSTDATARRPDPRLRALVAEAARLAPELGFAAQLIDAGYRWLAGEPVAVPPWRRADDYPDELLPVAVVGFRTTDVELPELGDGYPPGLTEIRHQHNCISCAQIEVFGYLLAMPPELARLIEELDWALCGYDPLPPLAAWRERLAPWLGSDIGYIREGVVLAKGPPPHALGGLDLLHAGTRFAPWRMATNVETHGDIVRDGRFGPEHVEALRRLGDELGLEPCTAILSENCD